MVVVFLLPLTLRRCAWLPSAVHITLHSHWPCTYPQSAAGGRRDSLDRQHGSPAVLHMVSWKKSSAWQSLLILSAEGVAVMSVSSPQRGLGWLS